MYHSEHAAPCPFTSVTRVSDTGGIPALDVLLVTKERECPKRQGTFLRFLRHYLKTLVILDQFISEFTPVTILSVLYPPLSDGGQKRLSIGWFLPEECVSGIQL